MTRRMLHIAAMRAVPFLILALVVLVGTPAFGQNLPGGVRRPPGLGARPGTGSFPWETLLRLLGLAAFVIVFYLLCFPGWFRSALRRGGRWPMDAYGIALCFFCLLVGSFALLLLWPLLELKVLVPSLRSRQDITPWMNYWLIRIVILPSVTLLFALWGLFMHRSEMSAELSTGADDQG